MKSIRVNEYNFRLQLNGKYGEGRAHRLPLHHTFIDQQE